MTTVSLRQTILFTCPNMALVQEDLKDLRGFPVMDLPNIQVNISHKAPANSTFLSTGNILL